MPTPCPRTLAFIGLIHMALLAPTSTAQIAFSPVHPIAPAVEAFCFPAVLADFDGDGDTDLLQPHFLSPVFGYARNQGGKYPQMTTIPALPLLGTIHPADVNNDGLVDLMAADNQGILVLLGQGYGRFGPVITSGSSSSLSLAVEDFDGDHLPDVLVYQGVFPGTSGEIVFRQGQGDGTFGSEQAVIPMGTDVAAVEATGDIDGNGLCDVVITTGFVSSLPRIFSVLSRGDGTFGPAIKLPTDATGTVAVADFDQDGRPDLAYLSAVTGVVTLFQQCFPLRFVPVATSSGWVAGDVLDTTNVDGDGFPDLVASGNLSGFSWARNRGAR